MYRLPLGVVPQPHLRSSLLIGSSPVPSPPFQVSNGGFEILVDLGLRVRGGGGLGRAGVLPVGESLQEDPQGVHVELETFCLACQSARRRSIDSCLVSAAAAGFGALVCAFAAFLISRSLRSSSTHVCAWTLRLRALSRLVLVP